MLERLDAAITAALQPLQAAMDGKAAEEVQPLAQVRLMEPFTEAVKLFISFDFQSHS